MGKGGSVLLEFTPENGMTEVVTQFMNDIKPGQYLQTATWNDAPHLTEETKEQLLAAYPPYQREMRSGTGYPFFIFSPDGETLLGGVTLGQIQRGVSQSGVLGYWMGERYAAKGFMTAAVRAVVSFSFDTLQLNRVDAACLPNNTASVRLLEKVGFSREGYARQYLCIDGRWQDHLLYGLVRNDPRG